MKEKEEKNKEMNTFYDILIDKYKGDMKDVAACKINGSLHNLNDKTSGKHEKIEVVPFSSELGMKVYVNTLQFVFIKATLELFPKSKITIQHSFSKSIYGEIEKKEKLTKAELEKIKTRMKEIIKSNKRINIKCVEKNEAIKIFESYGMEDKINLLKYTSIDKVELYELDGYYDYSYSKIAATTGVLKVFELEEYLSGFILRRPDIKDLSIIPPLSSQKSLSNIFLETKKWLSILGIGEVGSLNKKILDGELQDIIMVSEALHEKKIAKIADEISEKKDVKIILIAGPSSSGKTTFSKRLSIQLRVNGIKPIPLSLDNYFVNRVDTPKDENGEYDFETINALDLDLLNENLQGLMKGEEVDLPTYDFKKGEKEWTGYKEKLPENGVLILEGIHGLNPNLISKKLNNNVFKIYISALTQLNIDNHNRISTTDSRKVRRIVRDSLSRGYAAEDTLKMWPSIKRGENKNIFIYQEEADAMFNSTLVYEACVLKPYALKELNKIKNDSPVYAEAERLKTFLSLFEEIDIKHAPANSLLREFIGGSCFYEY